MIEALLIRHAAHEDLETRLSGRTPGRPLTAEGARHAERVAARLGYEPIVEVHCSPLERTQQTAACIGDMTGAPVSIEAALNEVDFGCWAGEPFAALDSDPRWHDWNARRASAVTPAGERMADAQDRVVQHLCATAGRLDCGTVAMVTHCDIIRAVLCAGFGMSLNDIHRIRVDAGSISRVVCDGVSIEVISVNEVVG